MHKSMKSILSSKPTNRDRVLMILGVLLACEYLDRVRGLPTIDCKAWNCMNWSKTVAASFLTSLGFWKLAWVLLGLKFVLCACRIIVYLYCNELGQQL